MSAERLLIADSAGFCFGVRRAVAMAEEALSGAGECYCIGQLIHNDAVINELTARGMKFVGSPEDIPRGARVLLRAHGTPLEVYGELEEKDAHIIDAVCPKVSRIHDIVRREDEKGRTVVVFGEKNHPEVSAICTRCTDAQVFSDTSKLESWLEKSAENGEKTVSLVFQTTQTKKNLEFCNKRLKKLYTKLQVFDTICNATSLRQDEARLMSKQCDAMVVIGSPHSANSIHLAEICREHCANVQFISDANALSACTLSGADTIGITAGASAPAWIIKEVKHKMSDELMTPQNERDNNVAEDAVKGAADGSEQEKSFAEMLEDSIKTIYNGETVTGIVAAITPTEVSVDLGTKHSGYIPISEFTDDPEVKIEEVVQVGSTIEASVVRVNDVEGTVMLSKRRLDAVKNWSDIEVAHDEGTVVEGIVTEVNKGGIVASVSGVRVFVPASQTGLGKDVPMTELLKKRVRLRITEVNRARRRVVGSIRAVIAKERRERAEKIWNEIEVGKRYNGVVKSLTSYGAFVDIGGIDGMVHVSELSWSRVHQPSEVVNVGDEIEVYVISFDKENRKISLGYKDPNANPWLMFTEQHDVGDVVKVKIVKLMPFGAFAEVLPGVDGLIHISQIADRRIGKPDEVLSVGDEVDVKITGIDNDNKKISLSIRALLEPELPVFTQTEDTVPEISRRSDSEGDALVYEISASGEVSGVAPEEDAE